MFIPPSFLHELQARSIDTPLSKELEGWSNAECERCP